MNVNEINTYNNLSNIEEELEVLPEIKINSTSLKQIKSKSDNMKKYNSLIDTNINNTTSSKLLSSSSPSTSMLTNLLQNQVKTDTFVR
jgi:hypothetical protein